MGAPSMCRARPFERHSACKASKYSRDSTAPPHLLCVCSMHTQRETAACWSSGLRDKVRLCKGACACMVGCRPGMAVDVPHSSFHQVQWQLAIV